MIDISIWADHRAPVFANTTPVGLSPHDEPPVSVAVRDDMCWIRVAKLDVQHADDHSLDNFVTHAAEHFSHDRIVIDFRSNGGGNDGYIANWATPYVPAGRSVPEHAKEWQVGDHPPQVWNWVALQESRGGPANVPHIYRDMSHTPSSDDELRVVSYEPQEIPAGDTP